MNTNCFFLSCHFTLVPVSLSEQGKRAVSYVVYHTINTAADAARTLAPLAGPLARYLFAIGLIGSGLVAIPVLLVSTSYAVTGAVGWSGAMAK